MAAIDRMCEKIDSEGHSKQLAAIGFATCDGVNQVGAYLLLDGDLPSSAERYQKLSPVEWSRSHETSFSELNNHLNRMFRDAGNESEAKYSTRIKDIFESCAEAIEKIELRKRYRESLYLTFCGVDPNHILVTEEKEFVRRFNNPQVYDEWCREIE